MKDQLSEEDISAFVRDGFIKIEQAFSTSLADEAREILWKDIGVDKNGITTWTQPVVRLSNYDQEPFRKAANAPILRSAYDQLVGAGKWMAIGSLGTFPVRFPSDKDPGDTGWHCDASFRDDDGPWRLNVYSSARALLMLFLFSDIGEDDAPTRILVGSHIDIPKLLEPYGERGLNFIELAQAFPESTLKRPIALATGKAGTVYLCHPFLVHGAQPNRGTTARFLAQPPLLGKVDAFKMQEPYSPVEQAIRLGLQM